VGEERIMFELATFAAPFVIEILKSWRAALNIRLEISEDSTRATHSRGRRRAVCMTLNVMPARHNSDP
jgi:hypothetical protein